MKKVKFTLRQLGVWVTMLFFPVMLYAQDTSDTGYGRNIYRPQHARQDDSLHMNATKDTLPQPDQDSLDARMQFIRDSIDARMQFIRDSLAAREAFVRDSLQRRERAIDSLNFLKAALPVLLEASLRTVLDEIPISTIPPVITEDLSLTDFIYITLPFDFIRPFTPWKSRINLSDKPVSIVVDPGKKKITSIQTPVFHFSYNYDPRSKTLRIQGQGAIAGASSVKYFKLPVDTVFYDAKGRIMKIKKYHEFYQVKNNYQKGAFVYSQLAQVRQFEYNTLNAITSYQLTNFCDRSTAQQSVKVCNMITYQVISQGTLYKVVRRNDPANEYSDGEFTYEFGPDHTLISVSFINNKKTENWKTFIELNEKGDVASYIYENNGVIRNSLLINYYLNSPNARYKVETIGCSFEGDGVCYYQINNMTQKSRSRDKLTMEWGPWR